MLITEFKEKFDVQNHPFGWLRFENRYFLNCKIMTTKNVNKT